MPRRSLHRNRLTHRHRGDAVLRRALDQLVGIDEIDQHVALGVAAAHDLVGGAGEATIIARVGEGIVTSVGSASDHSQVLENPDEISETITMNYGVQPKEILKQQLQ